MSNGFKVINILYTTLIILSGVTAYNKVYADAPKCYNYCSGQIMEENTYEDDESCENLTAKACVPIVCAGIYDSGPWSDGSSYESCVESWLSELDSEE